MASQNTIHFPIGTRVEKIGCCHYSHSGDNSGIAIGQTGTVIRIRSRYEGTPNAYNLYIVRFDDETNYNDDGFNNQYVYSDLKNISILIEQPPNSNIK